MILLAFPKQQVQDKISEMAWVQSNSSFKISGFGLLVFSQVSALDFEVNRTKDLFPLHIE